jgi:hypothetical protein
MKNIANSGYPVEYCVKGHYFKSSFRYTTHYIVRIINLEEEYIELTVSQIGTPQTDRAEEIIVENGEEILIEPEQCDEIIELSISSKHVIPIFKGDIGLYRFQWDHPDEYNDCMKSFTEAYNFAYELGMKLAAIKPR